MGMNIGANLVTIRTSTANAGLSGSPGTKIARSTMGSVIAQLTLEAKDGIVLRR